MKVRIEKERKDWVGRTPRWRLSVTKADVEMLLEALDFFMVNRNLLSDQRYASLRDRLIDVSDKIQTPLMKEVLVYPLFEENSI